MASFVTMPDNEEDDQPVIQEDGGEDDMTQEFSSGNDDSVQSNDNDDLVYGEGDPDGDFQVQFHASTDLVKCDEAPGGSEISDSVIRSVQKEAIEERGKTDDEADFHRVGDVRIPALTDEGTAAENGSLTLDISLENEFVSSIQGNAPLDDVSFTPTSLTDENTLEEQYRYPVDTEAGDGSNEALNDDHIESDQRISHVDTNARDIDGKDESPLEEQLHNPVDTEAATGGDEASADDHIKSEQVIAHVDVNARDADQETLPAVEDQCLDNENDEKIPHKPDSKSTPSNSVPLQDTKGAQILLSRFSSWRKKANEAVVQNVQAFSQTDIAHQLKTRAEVVKTRAEVAFRNSKLDTSEGKAAPNRESSSISVGEPQVSQDKASLGNAELAETERSQDATLSATGVPTPSTSDGKSPKEDGFSLSSEGDSSSGSVSSADVDLNLSASDRKDPMPPESSMRAAAAALYVRSAASVITDSVSSGFRGRYGEDSEPAPTKMEKQSQTSKILSSRAAKHMQSIIDSLDDTHEYVMLLGQGMLGVNLRQAYLKNRGVYVDFLVEGGAAYNSGVVYAGDVIQKVGNISVAKGTILNVPKLIADSKRPAVLVFSTGQKVETSKVNYIDLAIAMLHQIKDEESKRGLSTMPLRQHASETQEVGDMNDREVTPDVGGATDKSGLWQLDTEQYGVETDAQSRRGSDAQQWRIPPAQLDSINPANVPRPPRAAKEALAAHLAKRGNGAFVLSMMTNAAATTGMDTFRRVLQHAFIICALDGRRLPFLSRHFSTINSTDDDGERIHTEDTQMVNASVELMLFLELAAFVELYGATPKSRRRDIAKRIAFKFFLPSKIGNRVEKPMFDFSHLVEDKHLIALRDALLEPGGNDQPLQIHRSTFLPFQEAVVERLHGAPFISFLMSDECARMRGYLRDTAPYRTVSPGDIFHRVVAVEDDDHSVNHLLYNVVYLLCQRERETCGENDDIVGEKSSRVMGAAGGICCAVFIKKQLLRILEAADVELDKEPELTSQVFKNLRNAFEQVWDMFLSPHGGALDLLSNSNETEDELATVRELLGTAKLAKDYRESLDILTNNRMASALTNLVDNLVYDYAVNAYAKFREHPFHEWMCAEVSRASDEVHGDTRIPKLSKGCIARLLRRAELPNGISSHRPPRVHQGTMEDSEVEGDGMQWTEPRASVSSPATTTSYPNAHFAIVFGTDDGAGMVDRSANPALSQFDIRRYTCQKVVLDSEGCAKPETLCRVPPTIESYAILPLPRKSHFSHLENAGSVSSDGWVVSMFDFMIPGSDAERSQDGGTYGVSLVFQQDETKFINMHKPIESEISPIKLFFEESAKKSSDEFTVGNSEKEEEVPASKGACDSVGDEIDMTAFTSPITTLKSEGHAGVSGSPAARVFRVATDTPSFNKKLTEKSWIERVKKQRIAMPTKVPVSIGIVLVSSQNTVFAMRETLSKLLSDFSTASGGEEEEGRFVCKSLVELLGNFAHLDVEHESLRSILQPYLRFGSSPWMTQRGRLQDEEFAIASGQRLIESLPLVPLALLYVAVLLEQKVVFSSSRRGVLLSAATAITRLLHPFKWEHLVVPLVPSTLARDLLEYPAPFIIGLSADDEGNLELLNSLPDDVTLVDLDVGRVILAPTIAFGEDPSTSEFSLNPRSKSIALRSQILYLAQGLGVVFGSRLRRQAWCGDSPLTRVPTPGEMALTASFVDLQAICASFLTELVAGTEACCHWIEECRSADALEMDTDVERTVLFDEDRFFQIKNLRAMRKFEPLFADSPGVGELALSLDDFDLVLECFLRCQSMSSYISSRPKTAIAFF